MPYNAENIIDVQARLSGSGLGAANFGLALLAMRETDLKVGASTFAVDTWIVISSASELLDYVEDTSEAYAAATMYFSVTPKPLNLKVWLMDDSNDSVVESLAKAEDNTWFFWFTVTDESLPDTAAYLAIQAWAGSNQKYFAATTNDSDVVSNAVSDDVVSQIVGTGVRYSFIEYHTDNKYAGFQTAALFARVNYSAPNSAITAFGKKKPGLTALDLSNTAYATLKAKGACFYTVVETGGSTDNGRLINPFSTSSYGEAIEDVVDIEAWVNDMIVAKYNYLMGATTKRPQTPKGQAGAIQAVTESCERFNSNGVLGAREYTDLETGETKIAEHGYVVLTQPEDVYKLSDADRAAKKLYPINVRGFRAGAAFEISTIIDVE